MEQLLNQVMEELRKNAILMRRSFHGMSGRPTLHPGGQGRLLTLLLENPGISQKTLCQLLHVRPQTMGEQLSKLESAGLELDKLVGVRTQQIQRKLAGITSLPEHEATALLDGGTDDNL